MDTKKHEETQRNTVDWTQRSKPLLKASCASSKMFAEHFCDANRGFCTAQCLLLVTETAQCNRANSHIVSPCRTATHGRSSTFPIARKTRQLDHSLRQHGSCLSLNKRRRPNLMLATISFSQMSDRFDCLKIGLCSELKHVSI